MACGKTAESEPFAQSQALCKAFGERRYDGNWLGAAGRSLISKAITGILIRSPGDGGQAPHKAARGTRAVVVGGES